MGILYTFHPHNYFSVVNLLVGLNVNSMQKASEREAVDETALHREGLMTRLSRIKAPLEKLDAQK